ncbi:hypothetical protein CHUAL_013533 [Chamberlinius hualienensis]
MEECIENDTLSNIEEEAENKIDEIDQVTPEEELNPREPIGKEARQIKEALINDAISRDPPDLDALRELATSKGGLLTDELRRKVWPKLLNLDPYEISLKPSEDEIRNHPEYVQVDLDVQRSLRRFPPDIPKERRLALQNQLTNLIIRILIKHKDLHYYQGYHDICITFLLVLGEELAFALLEKLSITRLKIFMEPTMESTIKFMNYVCTLIENCCPELNYHLERADATSVFCLSWLITWFGHVLNDYRRIVRLYDFFLATHQFMPIYLSACVLMYRQNEALLLQPDMATLHHFFCNIPDNLPIESLVPDAAQLSIFIPPEQLVEFGEPECRRSKGFYHDWSGTSAPRNIVTGFVRRAKAYVRSIHSFRQRNWILAATFVVPVLVAIGWYSVYHSKTAIYFPHL